MAQTETSVEISPAIWKEPPRGGFANPALLSLSGLEQMRAFFRRLSPAPPIHHLTGMVPTEVGAGTATFTMPATGWLLSPPGFVQLGTLAILADGPLGCAIQTSLPPFTPYTTAELSMNYARPVTADSGTLIARGRLIFGGRSLGLSDTVIEDGRGRVVAHGTSRCVIFPAIEMSAPAISELGEVEEPVYDSPDPYLRPVEGQPLSQEVWDRLNGLEVMLGLMSGELPVPPISHLTGLRPIDASEGTCTFVLPASQWLCSPLARLEGGTIALLAETAIACAIQTTVPQRTSFAPLDLKVNFLRPVAPDGRDLVGRAEVVHRGRSIAVANAELLTQDEKRVALATGTAMILPGRPWSPEPVVPVDETPDDEQG
ncbi:MAG TPA: PaaI family thioesterase [Actinomycetota bacterium]|nr:PaaI family thioesterase [Actinomycetota bacterium]